MNASTIADADDTQELLSWITLQSHSRVIALVATQVATRGIVEGPDQAKDAENGPLLPTAGAQNLACALTPKAVINLQEDNA